MIIDGVNFNVSIVEKMTREEFESRHIGILWQDKDEKTRKKMLGKAYDLICKPARQTSKK